MTLNLSLCIFLMIGLGLWVWVENTPEAEFPSHQTLAGVHVINMASQLVVLTLII